MRVLLVVAGLLCSTAAVAADLPVLQQKAPAAAAITVPQVAWTGFYAGGNFGYGVQNTDLTTGSVFPADFRSSPQGWLAGAQVGYNYQAGVFVLGVESDIDWANISAQNSQTAVTGISAVGSEKLNWLSTIRGRFGILPASHVLIYATAGAAGGGVETAVACGAGCTSTSVSSTQWGWTAGGGLEFLVTQHWSVKAEGLYYDLGQVSGNFASTGTPPVNINFNSDYKGVLGRLGFNYRF